MVHANGARGGDWNRAWNNFFQNNPNATAQDVFVQASKMFHDFNLQGGPIVRYPNAPKK